MKINQDSIGDFFEAKGFNCKWFSPHYSVQSRKNAKFKIRNLEIFCDADFTNQKWCVQKGTLECVNMRNCGGTKESCRCSDERCKYLKSLVKDAQCWKLNTNLFFICLIYPNLKFKNNLATIENNFWLNLKSRVGFEIPSHLFLKSPKQESLL